MAISAVHLFGNTSASVTGQKYLNKKVKYPSQASVHEDKLTRN